MATDKKATVSTGGKHSSKTEVVPPKDEPKAVVVPAEVVKDEPAAALAVPEDYDPLAVVEPDGGAVREPAEGGKGRLPYIGVYGARATPEVAASLDNAGIGVMDFYVFHEEAIPVKPFSIHLIRVNRLFTLQDQDTMQVVGASLTNPQAKFAAGYREHVFGVALVRLTDDEGNTRALIPAKLELRSGLCQAIHGTEALLKSAADASSWAARSENHRKSSVAVLPGGRITTTIWATNEKIIDKATQKPTSKSFNKGHGQQKPTSEKDALFFNEWLGKFRPVVNQIVAAVDARFAEAKKKLS